MTSSSQDVRFGLIGFGAWGQHHANAITKTDGAQLAAICAPSDASSERAANAYPNATIVRSHVELAAISDLDVVDIVVPSHLHHPIATDVLNAGHHLLLEKPMAVTLKECDDLIRTAREKDRLLAIGHELRLSSLWGLVKDMITDGFIGTPQYALVELSRNPYRLGSDGWRYDIDRVGSWVLEEPIHFFDLACWYMADCGEPTEIFARGSSRDPERTELHDNFSAIVNFDDHGHAVVSQTLAAFEHHQTVKVTGSRGALWASWSGAKDRTRHPTFSLRAFDGETVQDVPIEKITGELFELEDQIAMMVAAVRNGQALACPASEGRQSVALCLAAEESIRQQSKVSLEEFLS